MKMKRGRKRFRPSLRFSPYAWAKLLFLRDQGPTEIGGFGIAREGDPLFIEDVALVKQSCTAVTVKFDDAAVADFFDQQSGRTGTTRRAICRAVIAARSMLGNHQPTAHFSSFCRLPSISHSCFWPRNSAAPFPLS